MLQFPLRNHSPCVQRSLDALSEANAADLRAGDRATEMGLAIFFVIRWLFSPLSAAAMAIAGTSACTIISGALYRLNVLGKLFRELAVVPSRSADLLALRRILRVLSEGEFVHDLHLFMFREHWLFLNITRARCK